MDYEYLYSLLKIHLMETLPKEEWDRVKGFIKEKEIEQYNKEEKLSNEQIRIIKNILESFKKFI